MKTHIRINRQKDGKPVVSRVPVSRVNGPLHPALVSRTMAVSATTVSMAPIIFARRPRSVAKKTRGVGMKIVIRT